MVQQTQLLQYVSIIQNLGQMLAIVNQAVNSHLSYQTTVQMCIQQEM